MTFCACTAVIPLMEAFDERLASDGDSGSEVNDWSIYYDFEHLFEYEDRWGVLASQILVFICYLLSTNGLDPSICLSRLEHLHIMSPVLT